MENLFIRFALVGFVNTAIGYGVILVLYYRLNFPPIIANLGGYLIGAFVSYLLNRSYTFSSNRPHFEAIPRYIATVAFCIGINLFVLHFSLTLLSLNVAIAQALALVTYTIVFYFTSRFLIFPRRAN
jgi:putative flippase GtrA